ncbi:hypothetical protein QLH52_09460 [Methylomonas sp. OY6]|uniref:Lipoprotein n=1 Tax=Methylomonas defluvii TaxID=3045149 RepID=A0ABU4UDT9_9GAMM|nr:hypothetical protein [Methylomonas sp. OY6]MDX8127509.1 hypothetical protein [Methylomonas sp. OY6]
MEKTIKILLALCLFSAIAGCSTIKTQSERIRIGIKAKDVIEKAEACRAPIQKNPKFSRIYDKLAVAFGQMPSDTQLHDKEAMSESDIQLGIDWYGEYQYCMAKQIQDAGNVDPGYAIVLSHALKNQISLVNEVVSTRPTYGHVNNKILQMRNDLKIELKQWADDLERRLAQKEENDSDSAFISEVGRVSKKLAQSFFETVGEIAKAELELAQAIIVYSASQPTYIVTNPIRTTNCSVLGNFVTCTSY